MSKRNGTRLTRTRKGTISKGPLVAEKDHQNPEWAYPEGSGVGIAVFGTPDHRQVVVRHNPKPAVTEPSLHGQKEKKTQKKTQRAPRLSEQRSARRIITDCDLTIDRGQARKLCRTICR